MVPIGQKRTSFPSRTSRMRKSFTPDAGYAYWPIVLCFLGALGISIVAYSLSPGPLRTATGYAAILCFVALPIGFPIMALRVGLISPGRHTAYRTREPVRFWVGVVAFECLLLTLAFLACLFFFTPIG